MSDDKKPYSEWSVEGRSAAIKEGLRRKAAVDAQTVESRGSDEHLQTPPDSAPAAADSEPEVIEPVVEPGESLDERRRRLLGDVPPDLAARITEAQLDKLEADKKRIEEEEQERASAEVLKNVLADIREDAKMRARASAGLISQEVIRTEAELKYMNEEIEFRIDVPLGGMPLGKEGITVNGFLFQYGQIYKRPRHVFASLHETMARAHMAELKFSRMNQDKPGMEAAAIFAQAPLRVIVSEPKAIANAA